MKKFLLVVICALLVAFRATSGGDKRIVHDRRERFEVAPRALVDAVEVGPTIASTNKVGKLSGTAVLAAKMWNAYSTQGAYTNLIYYDQYSAAIVIVHRGDRMGLGSGHIYYNASLDGLTWTDQIGSFSVVNQSARHPNVVLSNPTKSSDPLQAYVVMFWNTLDPDLFQTIHAATDQFAGTPMNIFSELKLSGHLVQAMAVNDENGTVYAPVEDFGTGDLILYWTTDQGAMWQNQVVAPGGWFDSFNGPMVEFAPDGLHGVVAWDADPAGDPVADFQFGYVTTSDGGATWDSAPTWVPRSAVTGLENVHALNYEVDMTVDVNGDPHFCGTYVDVVTGANTGIYHVYRDGSAWKADLVSPVNRTFWSLPGDLLALNEVELARNPEGTGIYLKYIDAPDPAADDTLADVYVSARNLLGGSWVTPVNVTTTPTVHEKFSNLAPRAASDGTLHIYYTIFGNGDTDDMAESEIWYLFDVTVTSVEKKSDEIPSEFTLAQNYPNPFNPSTKIEYSLPARSSVTLKVYNVLGQEVATLVNQEQQAGTYVADFRAANLSSGVYLYKIQAGEFAETKKMMLVK